VPKLSAILEEIHQLIDAKRPLKAVEALELLLPNVSRPGAKGLILYNLGCLYRSSLGDGVRGRSCFMKVCEQAAMVSPPDEMSNTLWSNSCENLMILSLSYDEYSRWAGELRRLRPAADILRGQVPEVTVFRDRGFPWSHAMETMAQGYYSRQDPRRDMGMYGDAASIFHLLLTYRKELRLSQIDWMSAVNEYGRLCLRLGSDTALSAEKKNPMILPAESAPIVAAALPVVDQYLSANPKDSSIKLMRDNMQEWVRRISEAAVPQSDYGREGSLENEGCNQFLSINLVLLKSLLKGAVVYFTIRLVFPSAPGWLPAVAAFLVGNFAFISKVRAIAPRTKPTRSAAVQRQERIDAIMGMQRRTEVLCRNGHKMRAFEDEGVLLVACPDCGIVKPYPGTMARTTDLYRIAAKYDNFDF
jgi:hypothetical protein